MTAESSIQLTFLGHAGIRVDGVDLRMVMDCWLSDRGAFQGSWYQFPSNAHLDHARLLDVDFATLSHEHLDHMDADVLTRLPSHAKLLVNRYPSPNLRNRLDRLGVRNVVELDAWEKFYLNSSGDWVCFIPEQSPMCHDAAVLLCAGGASFLHGNDARLTVGQVRRAALECGGRLDVMAVQMSGASWHPICYEYPETEMARISAEKRAGKFLAVSRLVKLAAPKLAVPFAGPMCFLDPALREHNRWLTESIGIFPDQSQAADYLTRRAPGVDVASWMPGDTYDVLARRHHSDPHWRDFSYGDIAEYIDAYAMARRPQIEEAYAAHPDPGPELADAFVDHFHRLGEMSPYFRERIDMTVRFELTGSVEGRWDVDIRPEGVKVDLGGGARDVQYRFSLDSKWLAPVIRGDIAWEDLFLSLRFRAWRNPDIYNDYLVGLLKHAEPEALEAIERHEVNRASDVRLQVQGSDGTYEIARYCPHAGEDLAIGSVMLEGDVIRCLGHNLEFDLKTGACLNARCDPLATRRTLANAEQDGNREQPHLLGF
jgi:L-ascorbate metabolism protein UlaG (beta-lactamase superfamily)/nitrite reductase/ring-hydroxylating ferredoxin subunit